MEIRGSLLTLYQDGSTTDADQTVNVGERARVRTCFGASTAPCETVLPGDPRVAGLAVRGELTGPEVVEPLPLETFPGGAFVLPGFQQEGDYRLENIRLVESATGRVLAASQPSIAYVRVREIALTSARVTTLSLADLQARGITISQDNFQAFSFAVGFAFGSETVEIELPLIYDGFASLEPLDNPRVRLDGLPEDVAREVERWRPPSILPFVLQRADQDKPRLTEDEDVSFVPPVFGAIVLPGSVSYLNQFFDARLIVANGADPGTQVRLTGLTAAVRVPTGNVLRVVGSVPSVSPGQRVPVVQASGARGLGPGDQGSAAWTVEGLAAGTHVLAMDLAGTIERPGREPLPVASRVQAAVEVVDARFNLTFSHPDVVREGEAYSLFVTVTNLSRATQNLITLDFDEASLTGAHPETPNDPLTRSIESLEPGQAETVEVRFVADLTGKVVATTFQADGAAGQGTIRLVTGVGELGIPLSPATLLLPRFTDRLDAPYLPDGDFLRAHVRFLGLAHSLAVAPAGRAPGDLPQVIASDVVRRAVDLGQAGHRLFLGEATLEALEILALDGLGNRHPLEEIDELRRRLDKGEAIGVELGRLLRAEQTSRGLGAVDLLNHWAATASYTDPWLGAVLVPTGSGDLPALEIHRGTELGLGSLVGTAGSGVVTRTLPFGEMVSVRRTASSTSTAPLALVGHVAPDDLFQVVLRNDDTQALSGRLVLVLPDDTEPIAPGAFRRLDFGTVSVPAGGAVVVEAGASTPGPSQGGFEVVDLATGAPIAGAGASEQTVQRPPFWVVGSAQDFRIQERGPDPYGNMIRPNRHGNGLVYLFNRPPDETVLTPEAFRVRSTFAGFDTGGDPASTVSEKVGTAAFVQDDPRVVAVRYSTAVSPLIDPATGGPLVDHEQLLDTQLLVDGWGQTLSSAVPEPTLEVDPLHQGGLVAGRVVRGTGEPAAGAVVELIRIWYRETPAGTDPVLEVAGRVTTGVDGAFVFDFVEQPHWDRAVGATYRLRATVPEGANPELEPADVQEIGSRIRLQNRLARIDIALLGRGAVVGELVYADDGSPVPGGTVFGTSTLFQEERSVSVEPDGTFRLGGLPVGPITLTGQDRQNRRVYETVGITEPGETVQVRLEVSRGAPSLGDVTGRVVAATTGEPIASARVTAYHDGAGLGSVTTDPFGRFRFDDLPAGHLSLQAAAWEISRSAAFVDFVLAPGEERDVELRLADGETRAVTGLVLFHDPTTNTDLPVKGAVAFIEGPGVFATTDGSGRYRIEDLPVRGIEESPYRVQVIDYARGLQGSVPLPDVTDASPPVIEAQTIVLEQMTGAIDGVVLDPYGQPLFDAEVRLTSELSTTRTLPDGSFSFGGVRVREHGLIAHVEDGLQPGTVGFLAEASTRVVYGGHRPFVTLRMVGSGTVTLHTATATSTGVLTPIYYKPTWFHEGSWTIKVKGSHIETTTDPNGDLALELPVGPYEIVAYNPFHGVVEIEGEVRYAGEVVHHEVVFEDASTVTGQVVDVDGHTPVPDIRVTLETPYLEPQIALTDAQGAFSFALVPEGWVSVTAEGRVGAVERVGRTLGRVPSGGQVIDLQVRMKAQGTVEGRVMERWNGELRPLPFAQFEVRERSFPYRRLPLAEETWFTTDENGEYEVSHLYAGVVTVLARDSSQVARKGRSQGTIVDDWAVVTLPDVVLDTSVGSLDVLVRDPATGAPVPNAQLRLGAAEWTVTDAAGRARFDALALGSYDLYAFDAPTGRGGRLSGVTLTSPGQHRSVTVLLDQAGEVRGTLYDDAAKTVGVAGGIVELSGPSAAGYLQALATTSGTVGEEGRFRFLGIPEGQYDLVAALQTSPRRAYAEARIEETAPVVDVAMTLEVVTDAYVRLYEKLSTGVVPVDPGASAWSLRLRQTGYEFTVGVPEVGTDLFRFADLLAERRADLDVREVSGERRTGSARLDLAPENGTTADPYRLELRPRGAVGVTVVDASGSLVARADVTVLSGGERFPSVSGADGRVVFPAVPAGTVTASAASRDTGTGGTARGTLTYDDEVLELTVELEPAVSAHGTVYLPLADDRPADDPASYQPAAGVSVEISDARNETQVVLTDGAGGYRFDGLPTGNYTVTARNTNGDQEGTVRGLLSGPDGFDNPLPDVVLDASPPRVVSILPRHGVAGVSTLAPVTIVFSEALDPTRLPPSTNCGGPCFRITAAGGAVPAGTWASRLDDDGFQVVTFTPSVEYQSTTLYSLVLRGGPNGIKDLAGRPLTGSGDIGSSFETSDVKGPSIFATVPSLELPVDPTVPVRFDFSELVVATTEQLDGDGVGDAVELEGLDGTGAWVRLPVVLSLTRSGYSVEMTPVGGLSLAGDTGRRWVVVQGLTDSSGNPMAPFAVEYRLRDDDAPVVESVPYPDGASSGELVQGVGYVLVPVVGVVAGVTPENPAGDLARVEFYLEDPTDPTRPVAPSYSATAHPFVFEFVGAYSGDGVTPRPFPVWVQAVDTSTNRSNVVLVEMVVLPNAAPSVGAVTLEATAPVAGTPYAGSSLRITVAGLDDADDSRLTLSAELWADGTPAALADSPDREVPRPVSGDWADLAPQTFDLHLPTDVAEGTPLYAVVRALDSQGSEGAAESERLPVADDATPAQVTALTARLEGDDTPAPVFFLGESFYFELRADDDETAVTGVTLELDRTDLFPEPFAVTEVAGQPGLYRTGARAVPIDGVTEAIPLVATVRVADRGGNEAVSTLDFAIAPEPDPTAPVGAWVAPVAGAAWPAGHTSVVSAEGAALLLRLDATDAVEDASGELVPGNLVQVTFRGPAIDPDTGLVVLAADSVPGELVAGTDGPGRGTYQALWRVPDGLAAGTEVPFEARLVDSGGTVTRSSTRLVVVPARKVYERVVTAVPAADDLLAAEGDPAGALFLLDGTTLSLLPQDDGTVRSLPAVHLHTGAADDSGALVVAPSVLTAPAITTLDSAVLFHPLELAVTETLTVGFASRIDMSEKGLLGNPVDRAVTLPGETAAEPWAGGSHGGLGGYGVPSAGVRREPGTVTDSLAAPSLPGAGGTSPTTTPGGNGGGVVWLDAAGAVVRLDGDLLADGGSGVGGGGAGGAVRLIAGRLEGSGRISAVGGAGSDASRAGGGAGGRISLAWRELGPEIDPAVQVDVAGGPSAPSTAARQGGAGTVWLQVLDGADQPVAPPELLVATPSGLPTAPTPLPALGHGVLAAAGAGEITLDLPRVRGDLAGDDVVLTAEDGTPLGAFGIVSQARVADASAPDGFRVVLTVDDPGDALVAVESELAAGRPVSFHGRSRLAAVTALGAVRLVADDALLLGPEGAATVDDRAHVTLADGARALLSGEGPTIDITGLPDAGTDLLLGQTVDVSWSADDPLGFGTTESLWSLDAESNVVTHSGEPLTVAAGPETFTVPLDTPAGPVTYRVEATDLAGRIAVAEAAWTVLPNEVPTVTVALGPNATSPAPAGYAVPLAISVGDREGLASVALVVTGPADTVPAAQTVSGTSAELLVSIDVAATADGSEPLVIQAVVEDLSGAQTTSVALTVPVAANPGPAASLALAVGAAERVKPGESTQVTVQADDPDGLASVEFQVAGEVVSPGETRTVSGISIQEIFTVTARTDAALGSLTVTAVVTDELGAVTTTGALEIPIVDDTQIPVISLDLDPDVTQVTAGEVIHVSATVTDDVGVDSFRLAVGDQEVSNSGGLPILILTWTAPPVTEMTVFDVVAEAVDPSGNVGTATRQVTVEPVADDVLPEIALTCLTDGAVLPTSEVVTVTARATDDLRVAWVDFYLDGAAEPFARSTPASGAPTTFDAQATLTLPAVAGPVSVRAEVVDSGANRASVTTTIQAVDAVEVFASGGNDWAALAGQTVVARSGIVQADPTVTLGGVIVMPGATLTRVDGPDPTVPFDLTVTGPVYVACGGFLGAGNRGYAQNISYPRLVTPGAGSGGSHIGQGGVENGAAETFGSIYQPREAGGGGNSSGGRGGGVLRLVVDRLQVDGVVRSNGIDADRGGAGGSIWVTAGTVAGSGALEVRGGRSTGTHGSGGGGTLAVEYDALAPGSTVLDNATAASQWGGPWGGPGSVYLFGPGSTYGSLRLDNGGEIGTTVLPSLGAGTAAAGSSGAVLVTERATTADYFVGHWVEVIDAATGSVRGTARVASLADGTLTLDTDLGVVEGDLWQGIYLVDDVTLGAGVSLISDDPVRVAGEQVIAGAGVRTDRIEAGTLRIASGATLTHPDDGASPSSLTLVVDELVVEAGGTIDAQGLGYSQSTSYPGHGIPGTGSGGSHLGEGGVENGAGETFGSVTRPAEPGGGGNASGGRGGGVVRIIADRVRVDGTVSVDGAQGDRGGAGGSVWLTTRELSGDGTITARGGHSTGTHGAGGGGAVSVTYETLEAGSTVLSGLSAAGSDQVDASGAGSVWVDGPTETYGDLTVDNAGVTGRTVLPALGAGTAGAGSGGAVLETDRTALPVYFVGHWVEIYDGATTAPKGSARVVEIATDGMTVTLETDLGVAPGDLWQGVYRFDDVTLGAGVSLISDDPIRTAGEQVIAGVGVRTDRIEAGTLRIASGATLTHPDDGVSPSSLTLVVDELVVEAGGTIDARGLGYSQSTSYPGHEIPGTGSGGSHLGEGGDENGAGETFGSVTRPAEPGGGGNSSGGRGGGVVRIVADRVQVDGTVSVNGAPGDRGGAGGSVWLTTRELSGSGTITARGGHSTGTHGAGGGGAVSVTYETLEAGSTVLASLSAAGSDQVDDSGAGTVWVDGPTETYGDLTVDNGGVTGRTVLPALGAGTAGPGSAGAMVETDRQTTIPSYFVGHWVEIYDGATPVSKGSARIVEVSADGLTVTLDADLGVVPGDVWQGVYYFDDVTLGGGVTLESADPLVAVGVSRISGGTVVTREIFAGALVVEQNAALTHPITSDPAAPERLRIEVDELVVETGGAIDVRGQGFAQSTSYPGHAIPGTGSGGSHLGEGGNENGVGETFGSVTRPAEPGGGGNASGGRGGGVVRIVADRVRLDGIVVADGAAGDRGGAGGSVWISTQELAGGGSISADGGHSTGTHGAGGGGAIAVEWTSLAAESTLLDHLSATSDERVDNGAPGTIYLLGPTATHGDLVVDAEGIASDRATRLPGLGEGVAQAGSGGDILLTDRLTDIPDYFVGHWVRVRSPDRTIEGTYRVVAVEGSGLALASATGGTVSVDPGDEWHGLYRFDSVTVSPEATLAPLDPIEETLVTKSTRITLPAGTP